MKTFLVESPELAPGATWAHRLLWQKDCRGDLELEPASAAAFTFERVDELSHAQVLADTAGKLADHRGMFFRVRNHSAQPATMRANLRVSVEPDALEHKLEQLAEEAWSRGGDPEPSPATS